MVKKGKNQRSNCPITRDEEVRKAAAIQVEKIRSAFPKGVSAPALRALAAAKLTKLESLVNVTERELAALHGMGPKAMGILKAAMLEKGLSFKK